MSDVRLQWDGGRVHDSVRGAAARGLRKGAEHLLTEANRTVPIREGTLMRSGVADVDEKALEATVSYDTPYAVRQHEETTYRHSPGRRAKWLELTLDEQRRQIQKLIEDEIRRALRG